jgi:hypothetical protein
MLPLLIAGAGALKGYADAEEDKADKKAQAKSDAEAIRFSPWSGLDASKLVGKSYKAQSPLSSAMVGAMSGYQGGQGIENSMKDSAYRKQVGDYYTNKVPTEKEAIAPIAPALPPNPYAGLKLTGEEEDLLKGMTLRDSPYGTGRGVGNA